MDHGICLTSSGKVTLRCAVMESLCDQFPLHKAVFEGNLRKVSGCLRTCDIGERDVHGKDPFCRDFIQNVSNCVFILPPIAGRPVTKYFKPADFF